MTKWNAVTRVWLVSIVSLVTLMLGMQAGNSQQPDPPPPIPASGPPLISITPDEDAADVNQLSPEEQERAIDEALNNLWQHVPDLERHQMQPLQVQAENGLIAFVGTDGHLYLMNPDGSAQVPLVTNLENLLNPVWSPGDDFLAFIGDGADGRCLYKLQMSNRNQASLACGFNEIWEPRWSPDSNYLAFWGREVADQPYQAWVIAAGGGTAIKWAPGLTTAVTPDWIDNDTAVFAGGSAENVWYIYRADVAQPDNPQPITPAISARCIGVFAAYPVLSPDGSHIAYIGIRSVDDKWGGSDCYYSSVKKNVNACRLPALEKKSDAPQ